MEEWKALVALGMHMAWKELVALGMHFMPPGDGNFDNSGPVHLTSVDWDNADNRRIVAASLVQGVYIQEEDRQERREGPNALAPPWWDFFNFNLLSPILDDADSSIFGAIYEFKPKSSQSNDILHRKIPRYVIAFRGTTIKPDSASRDVNLNIRIVLNQLHRTSRAEKAIQAACDVATSANDSNIWLCGHSQGSALAMLCGKTMAKTGQFIESFLFNPPYVAAPIGIIKDGKLKHAVQFAGSMMKAGITIAKKVKKPKNLTFNPFEDLSSWVPHLFVNSHDPICSGYIRYFDHRRTLQEIGAGCIEGLASQCSLTCLLLMRAIGKESSEPLHLIPSATLKVNSTRSRDLIKAHRISQWWQPDLRLESKFHEY